MHDRPQHMEQASSSTMYSGSQQVWQLAHDIAAEFSQSVPVPGTSSSPTLTGAATEGPELMPAPTEDATDGHAEYARTDSQAPFTAGESFVLDEMD